MAARKLRSGPLAAAAAALALAGSACAPDAGGIHVSDAWARPTAPDAGSAETSPEGDLGPGVAYFTIENAGPADRLLRLTSPACREPELHRTQEVDGMLRMVHQANGVEVPAGGTVELAPGGLHVMLVGLYRDLVAGESVELGLVFESAGTVRVRADVRAP